ncbi:class F sortase [Streptosporangiaceae bacterium NEAU-GS5]|nr:class F sortase [Streptosporangiaceae bacterium NEAU-GS5]
MAMPFQPPGGLPPDPARAPWQKAVPALIVAAALCGIGAVVAALLIALSPQDSESSRTSMVVQNQPAPALAPTVGPGGTAAPLLAAEPTAPPPLPALIPTKPIETATTGKVRPLRIIIPSIGVNAAVGRVGVEADGSIQTPSLNLPRMAGWYRFGPVPGQLGPAVILGHVTTRSGSAVFHRLRELRRNDKIRVQLSDGTMTEFTVDGAEQIGKTIFPTNRVYGNLTNAGLRLITCGGAYNHKTGHYNDNIIVYATLTATR